MSEENNLELYGQTGQGPKSKAAFVAKMYEDYFLDYASYVILERAVPHINDGLKPVQRRILHAMKTMDDGRYNKVANIIGQTMQYHPHGDAAIGDALVNLGQKDLLIDTQGNWGDTRTGDSAAASRYIEARLSKFALEIAFNSQTTHWQLSYDGRKKEPITLPVKFPLLLAQGVEGIAVGLSTKILPHNFQELIKASIDLLKGKSIFLLPDFPTGGMMDATDYREGLRGGKVKVRAKIEQLNKTTLSIRELPYGITTNNLIESIIKAADKNKIKIKKVVDNTAAEVDIRIELQPGISPDVTIDALYAFTDCELSISPLSCVIQDNRPVFLSVNEILRINTEQTKELLGWELRNKLHELTEKHFFASLEKIFIENRIYHDIEECETWEAVIETIHKGLAPHVKNFIREVTDEDVAKLTEIKIKRISKYNAFEADELLARLEEEIAQVKHDLEFLNDYTIAYFKHLLEKYGKGKERKTQIITFDKIEATAVVANNTKLYANYADGFIGFGLKKDEFVCDCSDIDDIIVFLRSGKYLVTRISEKAFVGKDIIHAGVWRKGDERMVYNVAYTDVKTGVSYVKRFSVPSVTRDREYFMGKNEDSKILYFSANPNGEAEVVNVQLSQGSKAKIKIYDYNFSDIDIKGRSSQGNQLSKYPIRKIAFKSAGSSTLDARKIWYDPNTGRLNINEYGTLLGSFDNGDSILVLYNDGRYELTNFELTNRYDFQNILEIVKFKPDMVVSAVYYNGAREGTFIKRFKIETTSLDEKFDYLPDREHKETKLVYATVKSGPVIEYKMKVKGQGMQGQIDLEEFIDVKGWKALGNKFSASKIVFSALLETASPEAESTAEEHEPADDLVEDSTMDTPEIDMELPEEAISSEVEAIEEEPVKDVEPTPPVKPKVVKESSKPKEEPKPNDTHYKPGDTIDLFGDL